MKYPQFLIRHERLKRNWSQEGLCNGICTVSYLSKIEQGKADPSNEILSLLFDRLGIEWESSGIYGELIENAWELLLSGHRERFQKLCSSPIWNKYLNSVYGLDALLLKTVSQDGAEALPEAVEVCMDHRQLSVQRALQGRYEEAIMLNPCSFIYLAAGSGRYWKGENTRAIELLQLAIQQAASEGRALNIMYAHYYIGSCYSNLLYFEAMSSHYKIARSLALDLGEYSILNSIDYNIASTRIELGEYTEALRYFESSEEFVMNLHKLAICYEKTGQKEKALDALSRAFALLQESPSKAWEKICRLVELRLIDDDYLNNSEYGITLEQCFKEMRDSMPVGFCIFHMPWMLEYLEHKRKYKQAYELLLAFPAYRAQKAFSCKI